ncbi:hypothetical protein HanRHA438_Chr09g0373921 [Helianthus annuus]|nr:hypothetical protein HanHA300_Chr09g0299291 [Helianthus annuus]KAJ0540533.1 hypothetical protein HanHA89_Chr09g0317871 [Helianthus annuus]KAJ0705675.1 hypothetical protein HanLR1_Chr09g0298051 [Helianthus annuus]KAJ0709824.1 hypothetical protein HanOQP8_Chr09g0305051 [Helianthus annuus]KAJ0885963.1 hypothetical protein HanRHA438_Chr09g0373921 [Helianthus annuus]
MRDVIKVDNFLKAYWRLSDRYMGSDATCRQEGLLWYKDIGQHLTGKSCQKIGLLYWRLTVFGSTLATRKLLI